MKKAFAVAVSLVLLFSLASCAMAAPIKIVFAHGLNETNPSAMVATEFKNYLESNSSEFEVEIYPLGQLGGEREMIESAVEGSIQITVASTAPFVGFVRDAAIFDMPFAIHTYDELVKILADEGFTGAMNKSFNAVGLRLGNLGNSAFRGLSSRKPVEHIEDFQGLNMRTMENAQHIETFKLLGCMTTAVPFNELYTALQQGLIDAHDSSFTMTITNNFQEQTQYSTNTRHLVGVICYVMNQEWYDGLTPEQQALITAAWKHAESTRPNADENEQKMLKRIVDEFGATAYTFTEEDFNKGEQLCQPVWDMVREVVSEEVYNAFLAAIEKARS